MALSLLAFAAPASAYDPYPTEYCGPSSELRVIWYDNKLWVCYAHEGVGFLWEPIYSHPYIQNNPRSGQSPLQVCRPNCHTGGWNIYAAMDWGQATTLKMDYGDWGVDYQTIPQGNGAYKMYFQHTFFNEYMSSRVTATILGGAHNGKSSYAVWADPP